MAADRRRALGAAGEEAVVAWYTARGFRILDRNWRRREGEIDIVAGRGDAVVFCEVKTRSSDRFGTPVEAVTRAKQRRLRTLATLWLREHTGAGATLRFDVASVRPGPAGEPVVEVIEGIF